MFWNLVTRKPKNKTSFGHLGKKITTPQNSQPITHVSQYSVNQCWEVLTFWILEPMGKGRVYVPLTDGSQIQFWPSNRVLTLSWGSKNQRTYPKPPMLAGSFMRITSSLKILKTLIQRLQESGIFKMLELEVLWFLKLKQPKTEGS
jgi:hypothetical protein